MRRARGSSGSAAEPLLSLARVLALLAFGAGPCLHLLCQIGLRRYQPFH